MTGIAELVVVRPPWVIEGLKYIGQRELAGAPTAPFIAKWLTSLHAWWKDDETPWCGTAVAAWMTACGIQPPKAWYRAKAWADWGIAVPPIVGAVTVFEREGGGHVGLLMGRDNAGMLLVLGGNQGDAVKVSAFDPKRVIGFRWPADVKVSAGPLPRGSAAASTSEA